MKKYHIKIIEIISIVVLCVLFSGCKSSPNYIIKGDVNRAISIAINDFFYKHKNLQKNYTVFHVFYFEEEASMNNFYNITVIGTDKTYLYNSSKKPNENVFPSNYIELENKLFIWYDKSTDIDSATINKFKKYNLLVDDDNGKIKYLESGGMDDRKKGVQYFFCKNNLAQFKKIVSNIYVKFPKRLKCEIVE